MAPLSGMEQHALRSVNNCLNTNIYSYLETSGIQSYNLYLMFVFFIFSTPVLIRHLWQFKTVVFLQWCLIHAVLFRRQVEKVLKHWQGNKNMFTDKKMA